MSDESADVKLFVAIVMDLMKRVSALEYELKMKRPPEANATVATVETEYDAPVGMKRGYVTGSMQREMVELHGQGVPIARIARKMHVNEDTVTNHLRRIGALPMAKPQIHPRIVAKKETA